MRILFISSKLDRSEIDLLLRIHDQGIYIKALTFQDPNTIKELIDKGIYIKSKDFKSKLNFTLIRQIRQLIKHHKFDILHAPQSKGLSNAILASYSRKVKIIGYRGTLAKIRRFDPTYYLGILNPKVDRVICVNKTIYHYMHNFYPSKKLLLNYKGYDVDWAKQYATEKVEIGNLPDDAFVVMHIAQTKNRPHKGLDVLLNAFHLIDNQKVHLVFIGGYDESSKIIAEKGASSSRIHFLGIIPNAAKLLNKAHVFVLPSLRDGLPRVMKEAMAQEVPLIVTNIPGPSEMVEHKQSGLLVEPNNQKAIAEAIDFYVNNEVSRKAHGKKGKEVLINKYSAKLFVQKTIDLYKELYSEIKAQKK